MKKEWYSINNTNEIPSPNELMTNNTTVALTTLMGAVGLEHCIRVPPNNDVAIAMSHSIRRYPRIHPN